MQDVFLIVGLGNPGSEYESTRHNAGYLLAEKLATSWKASWSAHARFRSRLATVLCDGSRRILCQPTTYMNCSGEAVAAVAHYYRLSNDHLLVLVDDADLPLGQVRMRPDGSAGGHHGLESVAACLGTMAYARLRMGIGRRAEDDRRISGHVLGRFVAEEEVIFGKVLEHAAGQVECWMRHGIQAAMNRFNGGVTPPQEKG
jgi:PTH1 family peptidyl-tRNA hydrolase